MENWKASHVSDADGAQGRATVRDYLVIEVVQGIEMMKDECITAVEQIDRFSISEKGLVDLVIS